MEVRGPAINTAAARMRPDVFRGLSLDEVMTANSFGVDCRRGLRQPLPSSRGYAKEGSRQPADFLAQAPPAGPQRLGNVGAGGSARRSSCVTLVLAPHCRANLIAADRQPPDTAPGQQKICHST